MYDHEENAILGEKIIGEKRIIVFSSLKHLEFMSRARTISSDGTFKVTPLLWYQTFIVACEVTPGNWIPVAFGLLPDKRRYLDLN